MRLPARARIRGLGFNMTPMIDVVFLLIIFFLVSSHMANRESRMELELPRADTGQKPADDDAPRVVVNVTADGQTILAGRAVSIEMMKKRLAEQRVRDGKDLELRIRSDRSVPYGAISPVMRAAADADVWNVTFSVYRTKDAPL